MSTLCSARRLVALAVLASPGCQRPTVDLNAAATHQQLSLLMPAAVKIVAPFTRFRSFDDDERPDGIELLVQPVNTFGDPVNIAGDVIVELYEFRQASGDRKGEKVQQWDIALASERAQRMYWNRTTSMYEFRLQLARTTLPAEPKYVLQVTYNTPLKEHMLDECVLEAPLSPRALAGAVPSNGGTR
ncbi:MAG: hypothetical protein V2A79_03595 [Planctomycetota bacterium]